MGFFIQYETTAKLATVTRFCFEEKCHSHTSNDTRCKLERKPRFSFDEMRTHGDTQV